MENFHGLLKLLISRIVIVLAHLCLPMLIATLAHRDAFYLESSSPFWFIDINAPGHIIGNSTIFSTFYTSSSTPFIVFVDGSSKSISGTDMVNLTPTFSDVKCVPSASFNLLFVSHLTKSLNRSVTLSFLYFS